MLRAKGAFSGPVNRTLALDLAVQRVPKVSETCGEAVPGHGEMAMPIGED